MIISRLEGGLGNQLFQYAAGRLLSVNHGTELKLDNLAYNWRSVRKYCFDEFNIQASVASKKEISVYRHIPNLIEEYRSIIFRGNKKDIFIGGNVLVEKEYFQYNKNFLMQPDNTYLVGFWQNEKYIDPIKHQILDEIRLKDERKLLTTEIAKKMLNSNSVSVHIRCGDYLKDKDLYGGVTFKYYEKAIEYLKSKFNNLQLYVFSDDIKWVKRNLLILSESIFVSDLKLKDYEELILMSKCKHNVITNSSFSWWGAWLNQNKDKIVISPKNWFNDKYSSSKNIILDRWLKI